MLYLHTPDVLFEASECTLRDLVSERARGCRCCGSVLGLLRSWDTNPVTQLCHARADARSSEARKLNMHGALLFLPGLINRTPDSNVATEEGSSPTVLSD